MSKIKNKQIVEYINNELVNIVNDVTSNCYHRTLDEFNKDDFNKAYVLLKPKEKARIMGKVDILLDLVVLWDIQVHSRAYNLLRHLEFNG